MRTGFRIGQGVVMSGQVEAADGGHGLQLVVGQATAVMTSRGGQRVVEEITGIIHPVNPEDSFETALVETCIMGNQRQPLNLWRNLFPDIREDRCVLRILRSQAVNPAAEPLVIFRLRVDQAVERVYHDPAPHDDDAHAADAGRLLVGGLEIYGGKIGHRTIFSCKYSTNSRSFHPKFGILAPNPSFPATCEGFCHNYFAPVCEVLTFASAIERKRMIQI